MYAYYDSGATVRATHEAEVKAIDNTMEGDAQGAVAPITGVRRKRPGGGDS